MRSLRILAFISFILFVGAVTAVADPRLKLVKSGTSSTVTDWIIMGTSTYSLDARLNTDGNLAGGIQFYISTTPADALTYGTTPITVLNNPFTAADLQLFPTSGSVVNSGKQTAFLTDSVNYAAFSDNAIASFQFNTALLTAGTYVFTPEGVELLWWPDGSITSFASPVTFTLQVVPEPCGSVLLMLGGFVVGRRTRRRPVCRS